MSFVGYKGTSAPKLFVSFDKSELQESSDFTNYTDPLKLANCFESWEYNFGNSNTGLATLKIINPAVDLEEKLFSWYAAINPNGRRAAEFKTMDLKESIAELSNFYVRWGYVVPNPNAGAIVPNPDSEKYALSHLHKFVLNSMEYQITNNKDKVVILTLVNVTEQTYNEQDFTQRERAISMNLCDETGKVRRPSLVIQECLLLLCGDDTAIGFSKWTPEQQDLVDNDFERVLAKALGVENHSPRTPGTPGPRQVDIQETLPLTLLDAWKSYPEQKDPANPSARPWIIMDALRTFYASLGFTNVLFINTNKTPNPPFKGPSMNQGTGAPSNKTVAPGSTDNPRLKKFREGNELNAMDGALNGAMTADTETVDNIMIIDPNRLDYFGIPGVYPPTPMVPPLPLGVPPYASMLLHKVKGEDKYISAMTETQLDRILTQGYFYCAPLQFAPIVTAGNHTFLSWAASAPDFHSDTDNQLAFKLEGDVDPVRLIIKNKIEALQAKKKAAQEANEDIPENPAALEAETQVTLEVFGPKYSTERSPLLDVLTQRPSAHQVFYTSQDLVLDRDNLVRQLNEKYFKAASMYLNHFRLELANIPPSKRPLLQEALGPWEERGIEWDADGDVSIQLFGPQSLFGKVGESFGEINSFPIEAENFSNGISLATGFSKRGDNIITNLSWTENTGSVYWTLRNTPITIQKLYSVAKRFENSRYQDEVMSQLKLEFASNSNVVKVDSATSQNGVLAGPTVKRDVAMVGNLVFPSVIVTQALSQAINYSDIIQEVEDSAQLNAIDTEELQILVKNDLAYILNNDLVEAFFPKISTQHRDSIFYRFSVYGDEVHKDARRTNAALPYYRYVAKSPLSILQKDVPKTYNSDGSTSRELEQLALPILTQAKMQELNMLKKQVFNLKISTLGIPEMDVGLNEFMNRKVAVWVHEPRVPGTFHWITGVYVITSFQHKIDVSGGYVTNFELQPSSFNDADNLSKFTFVKGGYNTAS